MTSGPLIDLGSFPSPDYGNDEWFGTFIPVEIEKLKRLLSAIEKWQEISDVEFEEFKRACEQKRTAAWDEHGYDPAQDEAFMLLETERVMFANLAVTIASAAENFIIGICKLRGVKYVNDSGETRFGIACQGLGGSLKAVIPELPGYGGNQRARLLGNCFKHCEGKTNQQFVDKYGGNLGEVIEYECESWEEMIGDTETLLREIVSRLKTESKI